MSAKTLTLFLSTRFPLGYKKQTYLLLQVNFYEIDIDFRQLIHKMTYDCLEIAHNFPIYFSILIKRMFWTIIAWISTNKQLSLAMRSIDCFDWKQKKWKKIFSAKLICAHNIQSRNQRMSCFGRNRGYKFRISIQLNNDFSIHGVNRQVI